MKILIVDDSQMIRMMVSGMLGRLGYTAEVAIHGADAVAKLQKGEQYDITLLDWNMPELDGPGFLDAVRDQNLPAGRIIMMTTENSPEFIMKALEKGASEYIMKPFTEDILKDKIELVAKSA